MKEKICIKCFITKPISEFSFNALGYQYGSCILCIKAYQAAYRLANRHKIVEYNKKIQLSKTKKVKNICRIRNCKEPLYEYKGLTEYCRSHAFDKINE